VSGAFLQAMNTPNAMLMPVAGLAALMLTLAVRSVDGGRGDVRTILVSLPGPGRAVVPQALLDGPAQWPAWPRSAGRAVCQALE
jgi:hypothetical protein